MPNLILLNLKLLIQVFWIRSNKKIINKYKNKKCKMLDVKNVFQRNYFPQTVRLMWKKYSYFGRHSITQLQQT